MHTTSTATTTTTTTHTHTQLASAKDIALHCACLALPCIAFALPCIAFPCRAVALPCLALTCHALSCDRHAMHTTSTTTTTTTTTPTTHFCKGDAYVVTHYIINTRSNRPTPSDSSSCAYTLCSCSHTSSPNHVICHITGQGHIAEAKLLT